MNIAYISQGSIHLKRDGSASKLIESKFGLSLRQRTVELERRNSWKTQGRGAQFMRGGMLWGTPEDGDIQVAITGLSPLNSTGDLVYSLETPEIGGLFLLTEDGRQEQRLLHTSDYRVREVAATDDGKRLACVFDRRGSSSIAVMGTDGSEISEVTEGDSTDLAPAWAFGSDSELVFQSAGIARDAQGRALGRGPFSIQHLDLRAGEIRPLLEDPAADLLSPRIDGEAALYFIRRPYADPFAKQPWWRGLLDFLLFPFRLLYAIFQFLNFFTVRYTGNTLTTAAGARQREADLKQMMIWGNLINARHAARESDGEDAPDLVPKSWVLVRRRQDGESETLARGVLSFDLCRDGSILYSNGSAVFRRAPDGKTEKVLKDSLISRVIALP